MAPGRHSDVPLLITKKERRAQAGCREPLATPAVETEALGGRGTAGLLSGALQNASTVPKERLGPERQELVPGHKPGSSRADLSPGALTSRLLAF